MIPVVHPQNRDSKGAYDFFAALFPEAIVIDTITDEEFYFTAVDFKHGCVPWHMNDTAYWKYKYLIIDKIKFWEN